jgi:putative peptidoglycan lipid II flippase
VSGSLAVFNLANNLQSFPVGIFGLSFAIAAFPAIAASAFDKDRLVYYFSKTLRQIFYFIIPSTVVLILLRAQIVRLVLGSGKFDWNDTILTMNTLTFFALSLFAQATIPLLVRFYYARHDSRTPLYLGLIASAVNIVLNYYLVHSSLGVAALALSFSLSSIVQFALLFIFLRIELGSLDEGLLFKSIGKMLLAASAAGLVIQLMKTWLGFSLEISFGWQLLLQFVLPASTGLAVYGIVTYWLKSPEILNLLKHVQGRLPWRQVGASDQGEARGI